MTNDALDLMTDADVSEDENWNHFQYIILHVSGWNNVISVVKNVHGKSSKIPPPIQLLRNKKAVLEDINSMKKISLSLTAHYAREWGTWEGVREFVQNWHDGLYDTKKELEETGQSQLTSSSIVFSMENVEHRFIIYKAHLQHGEMASHYLGYIILDKIVNKLYLINKHTSLHKRILLIGYSKKALSSNVIGQFGEGMKIGALSLVREGRMVIMETNEEVWRFNLYNEENFGEKVLTVLVSEQEPANPVLEGSENIVTSYSDLPVDIEPLDTVTTISMENEKWSEIKTRFLFLHPPDDDVKTEIGSLLLDDNYNGQLYVKGVWVSDMSSEDLSTGVNFINLRIDRDRNAVPRPSEIDHMVSCMWVKALEARPQLSTKYFTLLQNDKFRDVRQALQYASVQFAVAVAEEFARYLWELCKAITNASIAYNKYGTNAFPVSTHSDIALIASQIKKQVVVCNETLLAILLKSGKHRTLEEELLDITTKEWELFPIQTLPGDEKSVLDHAISLIQLGYPDFTKSTVDVINIVQPSTSEGCIAYGDRIQVPLWMLKDSPELNQHIKPCKKEVFTMCLCRETRLVCSMTNVLDKRQRHTSMGDWFSTVPDSCDHRLLKVLQPLAMQEHRNAEMFFCADIHSKQSSVDKSDHSLCIEREHSLHREIEELKENLSTLTKTHKNNLESLKSRLAQTEKDLMARETDAINTEQRLHNHLDQAIRNSYQSKLNALETKIQNLKSTEVRMKTDLECWKTKVATTNKQLADMKEAMERQHDVFLEEMLHYVEQCKSRTETIQKLCSDKIEQEDLTSEAKDKLQLLVSLSHIISEDLQRDKFLCTVCLTKRKEVLLTPCSHYTMCADCASEIMLTTRQCPVCKTRIINSVKVYG